MVLRVLRSRDARRFVAQTKGGIPMGDKSPKSKDKQKKQDKATKDQKKSATAARTPSTGAATAPA